MNQMTPAPRLTPIRSRVAICLVLALGTLALYWPVTHYDFTNVDDTRFVTENPTVQAGLTWPGAIWAFKSVYTEAWQPITWFSHMLDCQIYGLKAGGHHLTSVLFHVANTLLLFLWLENLTRLPWRSAFVAALFAWHPLHVESVAWVCERKDVLSAFFWLLALMAYTRYARKPGVLAYLPVLALYALGLMSKPIIITLPCLCLLLDFWPLNRFQLWSEAAGTSAWKPLDKGLARRAALLIAEKVPFLVLAAGMSAIAIYAQKAGGSLAGLSGFPMSIRIENALASYLSYLTTTFWPARLAYFYPYSFHIPLTVVLESGLLLAIWTIWFAMRIRQQPYLLVGWLWFLGTLVPTIGLVQFCIQARADRYTYIPSVGLFLVVVWGVNDLFARWPERKKYLPVIGGLALAACLAVSSVQIRYWQNSFTVAAHALEVTQDNYVASEALGRAITAMGHPDKAVPFIAEAVRIAPEWPQGQFNLGITEAEIGNTNEAIEHMQDAVRLAPDFLEGRLSFGRILFRFGKTDEAIQQFAEAARLAPQSADAQFNWGIALVTQNKIAEAIPHFSEAVRLNPANADGWFNLGLACLNTHEPDKAAAAFAEEAKRAPNDTKAHFRLAQALEQQGKFAEAVLQYRQALRLTPGFPEASSALDRILSLHPDLK